MRLLVAESDEALGAFLRQGLEAEHYSVEVARDGAGAEELAAAHEFDLVILDLNLPGIDGMDVLRRLRARDAGLPILILTNKSRVEDRVRAFDEGADDFLLMPFAFSELSARVRALLRRGGRGAEPVLRADDLELDRLARIVRRGGRRIELTPKEYGLLEFLMTHMGQRVTRPMIIENVWNFSGETMTNVVDVYINYSSSQVDKRRVGQLALAIQVAFQQMGIFDASNTKSAVANTEPMPFSNVQIVENVERFASLGRIAPSPHGIPAGAAQSDDLNQLRRELQNALQAQIKKHEISLTPTREGLVVSLREAGFYDTGSAQLRKDTSTVLDEFIAIVAPHNFHVRIEGHTDNIPIHSTQFQSNWELSTARATEMVKLFITRYGISPDRLAASGYAEFHPVATNDTPEGRAMNRRVDLVILNPSGQGYSGETTMSPAPSPAVPPAAPQR
ncbi:MAG: response regulator [Candidatus Acidiferrales bacterium]